MKKKNIDTFLIKFLLFSLPLIYYPGHGSYNALRYFFFGTIILILFIVTIQKILKNKWIIKSFFKSWYSYGLIAYFLSFILVSITSINPALSFFSSFSRTDGAFVMVFLFMFVISIYSSLALSKDKKKIIKEFLIASVFGAVILSLFSIFSSAGLSILNMEWLTKSGGGAMTGNQSIAGSYLLWNIFFSLILFVRSDSFKKKMINLSAFLVLLLSPLFINWNLLFNINDYSGPLSLIGLARGSAIGIVFGFIVTISIFYALQKNKIKKYIGIALVVIIMIGSIFGSITLLDKSSTLHQKFIESTSDARFVFWDASIEGFKEKPLLGWGPGTFSYSYHKFFNPIMFRQENRAEFFVDKNHNIFFSALNEGGVLLFSSLLFLLFSTIFGLVFLVKQNKISTKEGSLFVGALFGWLLQAQFIFDSILSLTMLYLVVGILYGSLVDKQEKSEKVRRFSNKDKWIFSIVIILIISIFVYTIAIPYKRNRLMLKAYDTKLPLRASMWDSFSNISPMGDHIESSFMFNEMVKGYDLRKDEMKNWSKYKKEVIKKEFDEMIKKNHSLFEDTQDYEHLINLIKISYLKMYIIDDMDTSFFEETKELIYKAKLISKGDPQPYWIEAEIEIINKNYLVAKDTLEEVLLIEPKLTSTHNLILQLAEKSDDHKYHDFALNRAQENIPGFDLDY